MPKGDATAKTTEDERKYIKLQASKGRCKAALARKFGISRQRVTQICDKE